MTTIDQMLDFVRCNNVRRSKKISLTPDIVVYVGKKGCYIFTPDTDFVRRSKKLGNYAGHCPASSQGPVCQRENNLYSACLVVYLPISLPFAVGYECVRHSSLGRTKSVSGIKM